MAKFQFGLDENISGPVRIWLRGGAIIEGTIDEADQDKLILEMEFIPLGGKKTSKHWCDISLDEIIAYAWLNGND